MVKINWMIYKIYKKWYIREILGCMMLLLVKNLDVNKEVMISCVERGIMGRYSYWVVWLNFFFLCRCWLGGRFFSWKDICLEVLLLIGFFEGEIGFFLEYFKLFRLFLYFFVNYILKECIEYFLFWCNVY